VHLDGAIALDAEGFWLFRCRYGRTCAGQLFIGRRGVEI
jgi:hypothetical protein